MPITSRTWPTCGFLVSAEERLVSLFIGGDSEGETPLPIPNREVKPLRADGTWPSRAWESRSPPSNLTGRPRGRPVCVLRAGVQGGARREPEVARGASPRWRAARGRVGAPARADGGGA